MMLNKLFSRFNLLSAFLWVVLFSLTVAGNNGLSQNLPVLAQEQIVAAADQISLQGALYDRYNAQTQKPTSFRLETILQKDDLKKYKDLSSSDSTILFKFHHHSIISLFSSDLFSRITAAFSIPSNFQPRGPPAFIPSFI
jgi:hypothetical protein